MRVAPSIELSNEQEVELTRLARSKRTSVRLAQRAQIVLLAAQGLQNKDIAESPRNSWRPFGLSQAATEAA